MKIEQADAYLSTKGWTFSTSSQATATEYSTATYAFNKSKFDSEKAMAWVNYLSCNNCYTRIVYQVHEVKQYNAIKARFPLLHLKPVSTEIKDGSLVSVYFNSMVYVEVMSTSATDNSAPVYKFAVYSNSDYLTVLINRLDKKSEQQGNTTSGSIDDIYVTSLNGDSGSAPLRASPNIDAKVVYTISDTDTIHVKSRDTVYYLVEVNGYSGYVSQTFLLNK